MKEECLMIYNEFRDAELNKEHYAYRIKSSENMLKAVDIFLALFATGSAVIGFGFWKYSIHGLEIGQITFKLLAGLAAVLSIVKPFLKLEEKLGKLNTVLHSYAFIAKSLKDIVIKIKINKGIDAQSKAIFGVLKEHRSSLFILEDKPGNRALIDKMQSIVIERYSTDFFWYPNEK